MTNKEKFKVFWEENNVPLFYRFDLFEQLFNENNWDVAIAEWKGNVWGVCPYFHKKKLGFNIITMPDILPYSGPWIKYPEGVKQANKISHEHKCMEAMIQNLKDFDYCTLKFHPLVSDVLPWQWADFAQTARITYVLNNTKEIEFNWSNLRENIRREIKKAEKNLEFSDTIDFQVLKELKKFNSDKLKDNNGDDEWESMWNFLKENGCGKLKVARNSEGALVAAIMLGFDSFQDYYLMGAAHPDHKTSGGLSALLWKAVIDSSERSGSFNFEGSMNPSIERFFRAFGGTPVSYSHIEKYNSNSLSALKKIKSIL